MNTAISAAGLGKRYGRAWALRDCSIDLPAGRIAALVGPNGAGKTTLLHLAVGLLRPTAGEIELFGWSPEADPDLVMARIGFVAQNMPLYDFFSVGEMLHLGRRLNRRWDQTTAEVRLRRKGIALDHVVSKLSGGQRAQVALALALGKRPDLLLLDEPLASLDPLARREFLQELLEAAVERSVTVLMSSHLIADLERLCDHIILLNRGQVQVAGRIEDLLGTHHLLVAPREGRASPPNGLEIITRNETDRQTRLWARGRIRTLPAGWRVSPASLEDLVLAYMAGGAGTSDSTAEAQRR